MVATAPPKPIALCVLVVLVALVGCAPAPLGLRSYSVSADALRAEAEGPWRTRGDTVATGAPGPTPIASGAQCDESVPAPSGFGEGSMSHDIHRDFEPSVLLPLTAVRLLARGDLLYVLGADRVLSTFDIVDPTRPRPLGRHALAGEGLAIFAWGTSIFVVTGSRGGTDVRRVRVEGLDVRAPERPRPLGALTYEGDLAAARAVDGMLYLATSTRARGARAKPWATTIAAIGLGGPVGPRELDRVMVEQRPHDLPVWPTVRITPRYAFFADEIVAGQTGSLQAFALGGPGGRITKGNEVRLAGVVTDPRLLDERGGIVRVISRTAGATPTEFGAHLSAFRIGEGARLERRGAVPASTDGYSMNQGARFDGDRAYVPLGVSDEGAFATFDFGDPAAPRALGLVQLPFNPLHVEPRGRHVVAFGYRINEATDATWVYASLFDASGAAAPVVKSGLRFEGYPWQFDHVLGPGGESGAVVEPERGFLALPYGGQDLWGVCERHPGGYRLLEIGADGLVDRGTLEHGGEYRSALWHRGALVSATAESLRGFEVSPPGAPARAAERALVARADALVIANGKLVRAAFGQSADALSLHVSRPGDPGSVAGTVELAAFAEQGGPRCRTHGLWRLELFAHGDVVYAVWPADEWSETGHPQRRPPPARYAYVVTVDVSDPARPRALGRARLPLEGFFTSPEQPLRRGDASEVVQLGSTLALSSGHHSRCGTVKNRLTFVDLADPTSPRIASSIEVSQGGAAGFLLAARDGSPIVLTSHTKDVPGRSGGVHHVLDRVDARNPAAPVVLPGVVVPGALVAEAGSRFVTIDNRNLWHEPEQTLHVVDVRGGRADVAAAFRVPEGNAVYRAEAGDDRIYLPLAPLRSEALRAGSGKTSLLTLAGLAGGPPRAFVYALDVSASWRKGYNLVGLEGDRALLETAPTGPTWPLFAVLDASAPAAPRLVERAALRSSAATARRLDGRTVLGLGGYGVQTIASGP
ncbi:MAG: beta-propeller domain-containing protein [Polyangiaceae bacterium]|jgi:hypothetical protein|nr:beta-propeller domain-containing protein [Polyangiaceae bacterium]